MKCKKFLSVLSMVVSISLPCGVCEAADRLALMRKKDEYVCLRDLFECAKMCSAIGSDMYMFGNTMPDFCA